MAEFELKDKIEHKDEKYSQYTLVVTFDNPQYVSEKTETVTDENGDEQEVTHPAQGEPQLTFEQDVILPDSGTDKAAQAYVDDYEKQYNELHKED